MTIWSLEQDAEWARFVGDRLRTNDVKNVELRYVPLRQSGDFVWYDIEGVDLPSRFELVLCDGPAVFDHWGDAYPQWRYGLLPVLSRRHVAIDEILLDDADEPRAARLLSRWKQEFDLDHTMLTSREGSCAVVHRGIRPGALT